MFLNENLFNLDAPDAWNYGGLFKVAQAMLGVYLQEKVYKSPNALADVKCPTLSLGGEVKKLLTATLLDCYFADPASLAPLPSGRTKNYSESDLFEFRAFNDRCWLTPTNDEESDFSYTNLTGRGDPYVMVNLYSQRIKC